MEQRRRTQIEELGERIDKVNSLMSFDDRFPNTVEEIVWDAKGRVAYRNIYSDATKTRKIWVTAYFYNEATDELSAKEVVNCLTERMQRIEYTWGSELQQKSYTYINKGWENLK